MITRKSFAALPLVVAGAIAPRELVAQGAGMSATPAFQSWSFSTSLPEDTVAVSRVTQFALPFTAVFPLGERWMASVGGAYAHGTVEGERGVRLSLDGLADLRLRLTGSFADDHLLLTAGATVPTGQTPLAGDELLAQRLLGAPVLRFAVPALGTGFGATLGVVGARRAGPWALAMGTSFEMRGTYQPIEVAITGADVTTDLDPGDAVHVSLGADRLVGRHRLSLLVVGDAYTDDRITAGSGTERRTSTYHVGPTVMAAARLDVAATRFRDFTVQAQLRHRSPFTDIDGHTVAGSSGTGADLAVHTVLGRPNSLGLVVGGDVAIESGLEVDNTIATAGATAAGATLGLSIPIGRSYLEPFARFMAGHIDTGPVSTSATSLMIGVTLLTR